MSKSKHTEAQMIAALKPEAGLKVEDVAREYGSVEAHHLRLEAITLTV